MDKILVNHFNTPAMIEDDDLFYSTYFQRFLNSYVVKETIVLSKTLYRKQKSRKFLITS